MSIILTLGVFVAGTVCGAILCGAFLLTLAPRGEFGQIDARE
jgi:hypothetical protein